MTYTPRIAVLEGLWGDTTDIIDAAGGDGIELMPWYAESVMDVLRDTRVDGLVLTGGSDISPTLYGQKPHKQVYGVDHDRDACEFEALDYASTFGIPVLGICRGSQIMCAYRGGSLTQHIEGHRGGEHEVVADARASTFRRAIGGRRMNVISLHHQCVKRPGHGMRIAARASDGTPEAIESVDGLWIGVQYHPEMAAWENGNAFALFQWLVRTAADQRGEVASVPTFREARRAHEAEKQQYRSSTWKPSGNYASAKHRRAGDSRFVDIDDTADALDSLICSECGMIFDRVEDRNDHMAFLHDIDPWGEPLCFEDVKLLPAALTDSELAALAAEVRDDV